MRDRRKRAASMKASWRTKRRRCWLRSAIAGNENPYMLTEELQDTMQEGAMIARTEEGLTDCLQKVLELQKRARNLHVEGSRIYNPGWHTARDMRNMLTVSEIIVRCALERKESRGRAVAHRLPRPGPGMGQEEADSHQRYRWRG